MGVEEDLRALAGEDQNLDLLSQGIKQGAEAIAGPAKRAGATILSGLDYFGRPDYALYGALTNLVDPTSKMSTSERAWEGLAGREKASLPEFMNTLKPGWDPTEATVDYLSKSGYWPGWATGAYKGVRDIGLEAAEPSVLWPVGKLSKLARGTKTAEKMVDAISGSFVGKGFFHQAGGSMQDADKILASVLPKAQYEQKIMNARAGELMTTIRRFAGESTDETKFYENLYQHLETGADLRFRVPDEALQKTEQLLGFSEGLQRDLIQLHESLGLPGKGFINDPDVKHVHRELTAATRYQDAPAVITGRSWSPLDPKEAGLRRERTLHKYVYKDSPEAPPVHEGALGEGSPVKVIMDDEGNQVFTLRGRGDILEQRELTKGEAQTILDREGKGRRFMQDPVEATAIHVRRQMGEKAYLTLLKEMIDTTDHVKLWQTGDEIPDGWRKLGSPGLQNIIAKKGVANQLDNASRAYYDPDSFYAVMDKYFNESKMGMIHDRFNSTIRRNLLPVFAGFHSRNAVSNVWLMWLSGIPSHKIPKRIAQSRAVQIGSSHRVFKEIDNPKLLKELESRGLADAWAGVEGDVDTVAPGMWGAMKEAFQAPDVGAEGRYRFIRDTLQPNVEKLPGSQYGPQQAVRGMDWLVDKGRRVNEAGFAFGSKIEGNAKIGVAIDFLKKHRGEYPDGPAGLQKALDDAAGHAQEFLFNYRTATPLETNLKRAFIPFLNWERQILGFAMKDMVRHPAKYGRAVRVTDRIADQIGRRPTDEEARNMAIAGNTWQQIGGVTILPWLETPPNERDETFPYSFLTQSYTPFQTIADLTTNPKDHVFNLMYGYWKGLSEKVSGIDQWRNEEINRLGPRDTSRDRLLGMNIPSGVLHTLKMLPMSRHLQTADQMSRALGGPFADPNRPAMSVPGALAWYLTGGRLYGYDAEKLRRQAGYKQIDQMKKYVREAKRKKRDPEEVARIEKLILEYRNELEKQQSFDDLIR